MAFNIIGTARNKKNNIILFAKKGEGSLMVWLAVDFGDKFSFYERYTKITKIT